MRLGAALSCALVGLQLADLARRGVGWGGVGWGGVGWGGAGLGWAGLGWAGLGWAGVGWGGVAKRREKVGSRYVVFVVLVFLRSGTQMDEPRRPDILGAACIEQHLGFGLPHWSSWMRSTKHAPCGNSTGFALRPSPGGTDGVAIIRSLVCWSKHRPELAKTTSALGNRWLPPFFLFFFFFSPSFLITRPPTHK